MKKICLTIMSLALVGSGTAMAKSGGGGGALLGVNANYHSTNADVTVSGVTTTTKSTTTAADLNLGYVMSDGIYLGLLYLTDGTDNGNGYTTTYTGYGPSVGYLFGSGWRLTAHYILDSTGDKVSSASDKFTKGTGMQVDLGYMFPVGATFYIGAQLSYRSIKYTTYNNGVADVPGETLTVAQTRPQLTFTFMF